jgi:serine/threonine-protein kinase HipA
MTAPVDVAWVKLWGHTVGAVAWDRGRELATFEYAPEFARLGLDAAPLTMPVAAGSRRWSFPALARETFFGLPGLLADALPDEFGQRLIDAWLARQGRSIASFSPVERLCYTGRRAMGALEFEPALSASLEDSVAIDVAELMALAQSALDARDALRGHLAAPNSNALLDILRVGTSAGGGRPKAVIALNETTGEVRSGQLDAPAGFTHWILKFDGVESGTLGEPAGYGRIEYAYALMARAAGIEMSDCRLLEEGGRAHFMTRRFDRGEGGARMHLQSLCALGHFDFRLPGATSYEQAFEVMRALQLPHPQFEQLFRRMVFNVLARNQDDHTKNFAFLMRPDGQWELAPAFDLTYAHNPQGRWTARHQMSIAGKLDGFTREDLLGVAQANTIKRGSAILEAVQTAVLAWPDCAARAGVDAPIAERIARAQRRF